MTELAASAFDPADLEEVRGQAPPPMRAMNLQIALRRTTVGVALVSALALGSGAALLIAPQAAQAGTTKKTTTTTVTGGADTCFFFAGRWWCP
jgi:hypothetical protein